MIGPGVKEVPQHPRSLLKRKQPTSYPDVVDIVQEVCSYETIGDYVSMGLMDEPDQGGGGSPASLESGYQTGQDTRQDQEHEQDDEDSNLSWLLNFKVSSLFDPADDRPPARRSTDCMCAGTGHPRSNPGKPPFTYTELIEKALKEQGELTVSGIYNWISTKYPYYNPSDDRWKNSVRHNLSINPHFRKGVKSRHGAGHLWTLSNKGVEPPPESWKRVRSMVMRSPTPELMDEAAIAAASIMETESSRPPTPTPMSMPSHVPTHLPTHTDNGLHRVAEEILSGVKRRVEVQYLVHDRITNAYNMGICQPDHTIVLTVPPEASWSSSSFYQEFLNPVSKEDIVSESGLDTSHCEAASSLLSEFNAELHLPDNLFSDELAFTCYSQL